MSAASNPAYLRGAYGFDPYGAGESFGRASRSAKAAKGTGVFRPGHPPEKMWVLPLSARKIGAAGQFGPSDAGVAIAKGMRPVGPGLAKWDMRASIRGGVKALQAAGIAPWTRAPDADKGLQSPVLAKKADSVLIRAAGGGRSLEGAYEYIKKQVAKRGNGLARAAWGFRGLYMLQDVSKSEGGKAVATAIVTVINPLVGAAMAAHTGITSGWAARVRGDMQVFIQSGLAMYAAEQQAKAAKAPAVTPGGFQPAVTPVGVSPFPWGWVLAGVAVAGVVYYARSS